MNANFSQNPVIALIIFFLNKDSERNLFFNNLFIDIRYPSNKWEDFELLVYQQNLAYLKLWKPRRKSWDLEFKTSVYQPIEDFIHGLKTGKWHCEEKYVAVTHIHSI